MAASPEDFNALFSTYLGGRFEGRDLQDGDVIMFDGVDSIWRNTPGVVIGGWDAIDGGTTGASAVSGLTLGAGAGTIDLTAGNVMLGGLQTAYGALLSEVRDLRRVTDAIIEALANSGIILAE